MAYEGIVLCCECSPTCIEKKHVIIELLFVFGMCRQ